MADVIDLSVPPLPSTVNGVTLKGPQFNPPPAEIYLDVMAEVQKGVDALGGARGGLVVLHDKAQLGNVHKTNAVVVHKLDEGGKWAIMGWVSKDWNHSGLGWGLATSVRWGGK